MTAEITDNNAALPVGWVFYDAECAFCARGAARVAGLFASRGFIWLPLQSPNAVAALGPHSTTMREQMKLRLADGRIASGIDAWMVLFCSVWWLWPMGMLLGLPGFNQLGQIGYSWVAHHRHCLGGSCRLALANDHPHHRHAAFFEMP